MSSSEVAAITPYGAEEIKWDSRIGTVKLKKSSSTPFSETLKAHIDARTLSSGEGTEGKEGDISTH